MGSLTMLSILIVIRLATQVTNHTLKNKILKFGFSELPNKLLTNVDNSFTNWNSEFSFDNLFFKNNKKNLNF